jgi:prepilin-type N-terminal cleavage/methylation domain-containing protein/prepilin-type processing-associated H-X9-DG protein
MSRKAFTLIELLVVIAIIAILAAILFPVFAQAKAAAKKSADLSNTKQYLLASQQYFSDNDDYSPLVGWSNSNLAYGTTIDSNNALLLKPYMKNFDILKCPTDPAGNIDRDRVETTMPSANAPAAFRQAQYEFNLSLKADYGYNTQYFSRMAGACTTAPTSFRAQSINMGQVGDSANTIYVVNSVWNRTSGGTPYGGGNWALDPPCRYYTGGADSFPPLQSGCNGYWWFGSWNPNNPNAWNVFGGVWPWHSGIANTGWADGHASGKMVSALTAGCDVRASWTGFIFDKEKYLWDLY